MKKTAMALWALCLALWLPALSLAESTATGALLVSATVQPRAEYALTAPASGPLAPYTLREGQLVAKGDTLFTIQPEGVYAQVEGTVAAVYVQPGDSADAATDRYGAAIALERADRYELKCTMATGYNSTINRNPHVGDRVFLRSADEKHFADGIITLVEARTFTVAVIGGDLQHNKDVKVYRQEDYDNKSLLARTSPTLVQPAQATASGTVVEVAVQAGDPVQVGDLLFTYVPDSLAGALRGQAGALEVQAPEDLVVTSLSATQGATVQKDQALCLAYTLGDYQLQAQVEEGALGLLALGDSVTVRFEELGLDPIPATVASISPYGSSEDTSRYSVYFDFIPPEGVLVGMHATLEK